MLVLLRRRVKVETRKRDLYAELPSQYQFVPFAVETLRSFGDDALKLVHDLGGRLRSVSGDSREISLLIQRVSLAIQRVNAASVLATILRTSEYYVQTTKRTICNSLTII